MLRPAGTPHIKWISKPFPRSSLQPRPWLRRTIKLRIAADAGRSFLPITHRDLERLAALADADRRDFFARKPIAGRLYASRLFAVALCQGAALHYVDRKNGVKDFDVWSFYVQHPQREFPPRRIACTDFGDPKFGTSDDKPRFVGRRVDLIGRSIRGADRRDPVKTLRRYLRSGTTLSARRLAQKAVVLIEPARLRGTIVWP
jgi:hypothetical protein